MTLSVRFWSSTGSCRAAMTVIGCSIVLGCNSQTTVVIGADAPSRDSAQTLSVRICDQDGEVRLDRQEVVSDDLFPSRIPVLPVGGDSSRVFSLMAALSDVDGRDLQVLRLFASFPERGELTITRTFETSCDGVLRCLEHQTCVSGLCQDARDASFDESFDLAVTLSRCGSIGGQADADGDVDSDSDGGEEP